MKHILCFGDSNTWGFDAATYDTETGTYKRMPYEVRWPGAAQNLLGQNYHIIEEGLNARTLMAQDPFYADRTGLPALQMLLDTHAPLDLVILHLGVNELKEMFNFSAGMVARGMGKLIAAAKASYYQYAAPEVLVTAPPPVPEKIADAVFGYQFGPLAASKSRELGRLYKALAQSTGCGFLDCGELGFTLSEVDCLHYTREDHAKLAAAVAEKIQAMLG